MTPALFQTPAPPPIIDGTPIPHSMKGYELYSWQTKDQWSFTLITGTNRSKTLEEIISDENIMTGEGWVKITVQGVDGIKTVLSQLPSQENIFWNGAPGSSPSQLEEISITLPPQEMIDEVQEYCQRLGLELHVSQ